MQEQHEEGGRNPAFNYHIVSQTDSELVVELREFYAGKRAKLWPNSTPAIAWGCCLVNLLFACVPCTLWHIFQCCCLCNTEDCCWIWCCAGIGDPRGLRDRLTRWTFSKNRYPVVQKLIPRKQNPDIVQEFSLAEGDPAVMNTRSLQKSSYQISCVQLRCQDMKMIPVSLATVGGVAEKLAFIQLVNEFWASCRGHHPGQALSPSKMRTPAEKLEELERLLKLKQQGGISDEEYEVMKQQIISDKTEVAWDIN